MLPSTTPNRPQKKPNRTPALIALSICTFFLFAVIFAQATFKLTFLQPDTSEETLIYAALSALIFLLFLALTFVLLRTLLRLYAERKTGMLGSKFRSRMVLGALLLSLGPVIFLFLFSYGLLNHSIEKWFSRPAEDVEYRTNVITSLLTEYAATNARDEAERIAATPDAQKSFKTGNFTYVMDEFRRSEITLQGGFAFALVDERAEGSFHAPEAWPLLRHNLPLQNTLPGRAKSFDVLGEKYVMGRASMGDNSWILVAMPLPPSYAGILRDIENSQNEYRDLRLQRRRLRRTYLGFLLLLTVGVLFASTWLALYLSKMVTRPLVALAEATQEISRGRLDYRVDIRAGSEIGQLVESFNRMAARPGSQPRQYRRLPPRSGRHERAVGTAHAAHRNHSGKRAFGRALARCGAAHRSLQRSGASPAAAGRESAGVGANPERPVPRSCCQRTGAHAAQSRSHGHHYQSAGDRYSAREPERRGDGRFARSSVVGVAQRHASAWATSLSLEDLTDILRAQKQTAWREVARRIAHEIKNPLTPLALSAERIRRHLERATPPDAASLSVIRQCAATISSSVETVRTLVDEFSTLARFPASKPQPSDINAIVNQALLMFDGRLDGIQVQRFLAADLPPVQADPEAIKRAVANLVDNAAEAVHNSLMKEIVISTSLVEDRDSVEIVVADTGYGVTPEVKERLFLPYFSTKRRGTGLGLAIVSRIVEDHRGSIRVEENSPVGARFIVELPVAQEIAVAAGHQDANHSDR